MATLQDQTVQHREMEVQTTPRHQRDQQSPNLDQSQNGQEQNEEQQNGLQQRDEVQDQFVDNNQFEYKTYVSPDQQKTIQQSAAPLKKKCTNCTSGQQYQKLKQQQLEVQKLKQQNDKLITNLRQMSAQLDDTLEKFKVKKNEKAPLNYESARNVNESELENAKQQLEFYQKSMSMFANHDQEYSSNRMNQWQNQIKEIDYQLNEAKVFNKNLLYIKREQERTMQSNKEGTKLKMLRDEVMHLKSLIREARRVAKDNEKGFKKTQEHTEKLKLRHEEVCKQFGVPFAPYDTLAKDERVEIKIQDDKEEGKFHVLKINEENIFKLQSHLKIIDDSIKTVKKQQRIDLKVQQKALDNLQKEKDEIQQLYEKRDKEIAEAYDALNNFKAIASNSTNNLNGFKVLGENSKPQPSKSGSLQIMAPYVKKYKVQKKDIKGLQSNDKYQTTSK